MNGYKTEYVAELEVSDEQPLPGPGQRLKKRREEMKLSTRDVAMHLNLRISIIEAIESNDYQHIPKAVFARGYLRSYAKLLDISSDEVIDAFNQLPWTVDRQEFPRAPLSTGQKKPCKRNYSTSAWIALVILVLVFLVAGLWKPLTQYLTTSQNEPSATKVKNPPVQQEVNNQQLPSVVPSLTDFKNME